MLFTEFDMDTAVRIWKEEGKKEGIKEGKKEGIKEGKKEKQFEIAKNLINVLNITDVNSISKVTGLSAEEINKLL